MRLRGKRALVTGASSGIGTAIACRFAAEGAAVVAAGRDRERTEAVAASLREDGAEAHAALGDVAREDESATLVESAVEALGGLDVLVNNAGLDSEDWRPVHEWSVEQFDRILAVNLRGPFLMSRFAIPHMLDAGGGSILHVSSVCAITVWAGDCAYDVSKAGLNMLSDHIAVEYAKRGIRSNTLMPGCIETALHEYVMESMNDGRAHERELLGRHPIGRFGSPEEVAAAGVMLCADDAGFMTGANVTIDGGYSRV